MKWKLVSLSKTKYVNFIEISAKQGTLQLKICFPEEKKTQLMYNSLYPLLNES